MNNIYLLPNLLSVKILKSINIPPEVHYGERGAILISEQLQEF